MGDAVTFSGRSFCFTGKLASMKRSAAQREARARGGLAVNVVGETLDYLVVGSIAAPGWKYGDYGTKIELARSLRASCRLKMVPEPDFIDALGHCPPTDSGDVNEKVFVGTYQFTSPDMNAFDADAFDHRLAHLQELGFRVNTSATDRITGIHLFNWESQGAALDHYVVVEARIMGHLALDASGQQTADEIERLFEQVAGVDGALKWFERSEGTAGFVRLIREMDQSRLLASNHQTRRRS